MSLFMTLFATLAPNNTAFIVARCLQGLFTTPPQCIGLSFIHDMYLPLMLSLLLPPCCSPIQRPSPFCFPHHHPFAFLIMLPYLYIPTARSQLLLRIPQISSLVTVINYIANPAFRFFFHEHARKIGIWAWAFVIAPYLGPFLSAIISNYKPWRTSFWIDFMIVGLALFFVTFLGKCPFFLSCPVYPIARFPAARDVAFEITPFASFMTLTFHLSSLSPLPHSHINPTNPRRRNPLRPRQHRHPTPQTKRPRTLPILQI